MTISDAADRESELDRIAERIVRLYEERTDNTRPYLLSRLGLELRDDLRILKALGVPRLAEFINRRLSGRYEARLIGGEHHNLYAIVPTGAPAPTLSVDAVDSKEAPSAPRYHYRFWAAFAVPSTGKKRYLHRSGFKFEEFDSEDYIPPDSLLIENEFIAPAEAEDRDRLIIDNIDRWVAQHKLDKNEFLASQPPRHSPPVNNGSLLDVLFETLDPRQLPRVSLPLDVILTLAQTRIGR